MTEKPIKEMTPAEREAFIDELKARATPEQLEALASLADIAAELKKDIDTDYLRDVMQTIGATAKAVKSNMQGLTALYEALRDALPIMLEETQKDPDAANMTPHEFIESGKFDEIAARVAARLNNADITADDIKEALPQLTSVLPQKHVMPNSKLSNSLTKDIVGAGEIAIDVGRKKGTIQNRVILTYEGDNITLSGRQPITEYDRDVSDSVTTLYEYGDPRHVITAAQVYREMVHETGTKSPSPQQIGAVTKSIDKMRFTRLKADVTAELKKRGAALDGEGITGGFIDDNLLHLQKVEVMAGGRKVTAYKILAKPVLYSYSQLTHQTITVNAELLDIRDSTGARIASTERRIAVKNYLLRRISVMKGKTGGRQNRNILYETLYSEACPDLNTADRKETLRVRQYVKDVLAHFKREAFITDYAEYKTGRAITGVTIQL